MPGHPGWARAIPGVERKGDLEGYVVWKRVLRAVEE